MKTFMLLLFSLFSLSLRAANSLPQDEILYSPECCSSAQMTEGTVCTGDYVNGYGSCTFENGDIYEGFFLNGMRNGPGIYKYKNGTVYMGNWLNDAKDGYATVTWVDGSIFFGFYSANERKGLGIFIDASKDISAGIWSGNSRTEVYDYSSTGNTTGCLAGECENRFGRYQYSDNDIFLGFFSEGYETSGIYSFVDLGDLYLGQLYHGKLDGFGLYRWKDGSYYLGLYKNGERDGLGMYIGVNEGDDLIGKFEKGTLIINMDEK